MSRSTVQNHTTVTSGPAAKTLRIAGIGASAGGLEAFSELLRTLPLTGNIAYVLVQHLDPTHRSLLSELLGRTTKLPVTEITNQTRVQPGHIYVIPPNCDLKIEGGILKLTKRKKNSGPARSIDNFLQSLAADQKENAIGVILSGAGSDGAKGLKAIKTAGGVTFAQDAASAKYDSMPRSATATGCVDFVLPPARIAKELARMLNQPGATRGRAAANARNRRGNVPRKKSSSSPGETAWPSPPEDLNLRKIFLLLRTTTGIDFGLYRATTINRRLTRRMGILKIKGLEAYHRHLRENPSEVEALYQDLLLNVTSFFRNPGAFEALKKKVFPKLVKNRQKDEPVRMWVAGCSTGQEAYSLAIAYAEFAEKSGCSISIQIFATDVNAAVLEIARAGRYSADHLGNVSAPRLRQFFNRENEGYRVQKPIRDMVIFAQHNLLTDPPFTRVDLITCRNLLIYFEPALQQRVIPSFHYALKPGGYLMLGASESVGQFTNYFEPQEQAQKIFLRKPGVSWLRYERPPTAPLARPQSPAPPANRTGDSAPVDVFREADRISLAKYAPPTLVVTESGEILQFRGDVQKFLDLPTGRASFNLLKMARDGLGPVLQKLLNRVRRENRPVREKDVPLGKRRGAVTVQMVPLKNLKARYFLVVFEKNERVHEVSEKPARPTGKTRPAEPHQIAHLRSELVDTREQLQNLQEEYDTSIEELQASNEEVQSSNEELQSLNEELETSNEELESANEELTTLNEELATRNTELRESELRLREQAELLELAPVLARSMKDRIIFWNRGAEQLYGFTKEEALGQTAHLLLSAEYSEPLDRIREQLHKHGHWEGEVWHRRKDGQRICIATQWLLHLDGHNKPRAVLEVNSDITSRRAAEEALRESEAFNKSILESSPDCIKVLDLAGRLLFMSPGGLEVMEVCNFESIANGYWPSFWEGAERTKAENAYHEALSGQTTRFQGFCKTCAGTPKWWDVAVRPILGVDQRPVRLLIVSRDITEQKQAERETHLRARLAVLRAEIASEIMGQKAASTVLQRVAEILVHHIEAAFVRIWTLSADKSTLELCASAGLYTHTNGAHSRVKVGDYKIGRIAARRKPHLTNDVENDNEISNPEWAKREGMVSFAGYPLVFQDQVWGVVALFAKHALEPHVLRELELTADVIAQFLQRKEAETERERLLAETTAARNEALAASRAKDDFLAALSHELRTPLNPVLLLASEAADDPQLADPVRATFKSIRNNVSLEARLIDDLLDLTRIAHGKLTLDMTPVDVQSIVREAVGIVAGEIEERRIELSVRFHSDRIIVLGDAVRLQQVFWNVLKNAIKYTPMEGKIAIDTIRDLERQKAIVRVIDNGIGLSDADLDRIFNAFSQAQPRNGGLGLGLTISRRLVENLGGTIRASSAGRNRGATFEIELPLANLASTPRLDGPDAKDGGDGKKEHTAPRIGNGDGSEGIRILLIEDHEQTRTTLQRLLSRRKFRVTSAASAEEARRVAGSAEPEILISDLGLPDGDGYSLFEELRQRFPRVAGIALSGYGMDEDIARSREAGFAAHLTKPIDINSLVRTLATLTESLRSSAGHDGASER